MFRSCAAAVAAALFCSTTFATPLVIQPDESASKDVMIYQFLANTNFDTNPSIQNSYPTYGSILSSGKTSYPGHDLGSLIQFDLPPGTSIHAGEVATLHLYAIAPEDIGFFGVSASAAYPAVTDFFKVTSSWDETSATWGSQPSIDSTAVATGNLSAVNGWFTIDLTNTVQGWINDPSTNHGLLFMQRALVKNAENDDVVGVFDSASGINRPFLQIAAVPEPTTLSLLGLAAVFGLRRVRRA
ncbi:MAG: DNRLRE domain-containing protein [Phycisphaerales bacterium]|nr:DNRLRE domain-containing protein [Phycisphaerales bacterium]